MQKSIQRIISTLIILALLLAFTRLPEVSAQPTPALTEDWRNSDYSFISKMMDSDSSGNIYVLGDTSAGDYLIIKKFSPDGTLVWSKTYDPASRLRGVWIAVDNNNNPIVLASIISGGNGDPAGWVTLKYDTDGNQLWVNSLPGSFRDARRLEISATNDIYVAGRSFGGTLDSELIKYDTDGGTKWSVVFDNGGAVDEPFSMLLSPDNDTIGIAGKSGNLFMALMYDKDGNLLWSNTDTDIYPAGDLVFGADGVSYFATGTYFPQDPNPYQMAIAKFDAAGNRQWVNSYPEGDRTYRLRRDALGNLLATGIDSNGYIDWMTIKTDADGNLLWSQRYDGGKNNDEIPNMLLLDEAGGVYVTGTGGPNPSSGNISYLKGVVAKYNSAGEPQWAVFDEYANGKALTLGAANTLATTGFGYLVTTHYTQSGLPDVVPAAPTNLSGIYGFDGFNYYVNLYFVDNANNEFWVDVERCLGVGCTDFVKIGQTLGENASGAADEDVLFGNTYNYRVQARGFMGGSLYSNTIEITLADGNPPAAPSNLTAELSGEDVLLNWQDNSNDENNFYIERCQGAGCSDFIGVGMTDANITTWTDTSVSAGESYSYRVRAWNSNGYSNYSNTASIDIPGIPNNAPVLDSIGDQVVDELSLLTFTATATDGDVPAQNLTFSLEAGAPAGASIDPLTGVFTWTPSEAQGPGVYPLTVAVTDDGIPPLSDSETIQITVNEVNQNPLVYAGADQTAQEGQVVQFSGLVTDTLLGEVSIHWDFGDGQGDHGSLIPTHAYAEQGIFTVTLLVTDSLGATGSDSLIITADNASPSLPVLPGQKVKINQSFSLPVAFTDPGWLDSHTVTIEWAPGVTETMNLEAGVTEFVLQHVYAQAGQYTVSVTVSDDDGAVDSRSFMITVEMYQMFLPKVNH